MGGGGGGGGNVLNILYSHTLAFGRGSRASLPNTSYLVPCHLEGEGPDLPTPAHGAIVCPDTLLFQYMCNKHQI